MLLSQGLQWLCPHWLTVTSDNMSKAAFYYPGEVYLNKALVDLFEPLRISITLAILWRSLRYLWLFSPSYCSSTLSPLLCWCDVEKFECVLNTIHALDCKTSSDPIIPSWFIKSFENSQKGLCYLLKSQWLRSTLQRDRAEDASL